ncbi:arsenate reductase ArsC [Pseudoduganella albidiflava]|uniref:Arsenate reductase ArsC n=1 Tax=Pseudoduganella albidiflava TaxID=321983 RepID=A0A411X013_9BURK|nr:arsenate reductase ArsC [Pseudoduganella albidiflava]QBI02294.1 arsenate reductase ArsC [Pseudoduganella albidiflava]GGY67209.1 protein-tyrosine-phosphatase [Pseudoduganella albidiflava]
MEEKVYNVLFLCTGNAVRSIMAEALVATMGNGRFRGFSAGSHPAGSVDPLALEQIRPTGYPLDQLRSKSWDEFAEPGAPEMDFIFTVCDDAAGEACPYWPGHPITAHWDVEDPAAATGTEEHRRAAYHQAFHQIRARMGIFVSLPLHMLEKNAIHQHVTDIGRAAA